MRILSVPPAAFDELHRYLDQPRERVAFLAAAPDLADERSVVPGTEPESGQVWRVLEVMYLDDDHDYDYQGYAGAELTGDVRPRVLTWADKLDAALIEVHSHGEGPVPTTFSSTDLRGLAELVPGLVWRLRGRPYGAIVFGGRTDHDSLVWMSRGSAPTPIGVLLVGATQSRPTGRAANHLARLKGKS